MGVLKEAFRKITAKKAKQLTERDQRILTDIGRCRVVSLEQIRREYWNWQKERTCLDRMDQLESAGYVRSHIVPATEQPGKYIKTYCLARRGVSFVTGPEVGLSRDSVFSTPGKFDEICHQVRTSEIYFRLSDREKSTYQVGDLLNFSGKPDATYVDDSSGEEVFIETDTGCYSAEQVREKISGFDTVKTIWVCPNGRDDFLRSHGVTGEIYTYDL